jgi:hypothetical protein
VQGERALAVGAAQVDVAARQRQAVALADRGPDLDAHRQVQVGDQAADDQGLLGVLLPEVGDIGPDHVQQLRDDGGDALEVRGAAVLALERRGQPGDVHRGRRAGRVDLVGRRREQEVGSGRGGQRRVARLVARIGGEVGGLVELGRVDEEGDDHDLGLRARGADEADVAVVQRAHRRHEADRARGAARVAQRGAQVGDGADGQHRAGPAASSRVAAASASKSSSSSGVRSSIATRWRSTVASSPRAMGPVSASGPSCAQLASAARTSGSSSARSTPAVAARRSAAASSVTRKLEAIDAAAW